MSDTTVLEHRTDTALEGDSPSASRTGRGAHPGLLVLRDFAIVVFATLVPLVVLFRLWEGDLGVPFVYFGDANFYGGVTQNIIETGWIQHSDRLGAPFGEELYDFPLGGDNFHWLVIRVLSIFTSNWATTINAFYLLTFFASSVSAFFCLRWLGGRRTTSLVAALLFAFLPFHFIRYGHLVYASYAILPVGVVLAVRASQGCHPFSGMRSTGSRRWPAVAGWVVLTALVGSCNAYYAVFSVMMIVTAVVVKSIAERTWRPLFAGAITVVLIGSVLAANLAPSLLHNRRNGDNEQVAERIPAEVDVYGLRVIQLLTPIPGHRIAPLETLSADLQETPYNSEQSMFLGAVGSVALLGMVGSLLLKNLRLRGAIRDDEVDPAESGQVDVRPLLTVLTLVAILVATMGGLAWFLAVAGFTELRSWNRISTLVAFLVLAWLVLSADRLLASPRLTRIGRWPIVAGAVALVVVGIADQTSSAIVPDRRDVATEFAADREYFAQLEEELPRGAAVFQLPYMPYPESPAIENMIVYDPLRPYLHTNELRWSYGGMKGRESDWQAVTGSKPASEIVDDAIAAGFSAILVDRFGYADKGAQIAIALGNLTGDEGTESADGRWISFDLSTPLARYESSTTPAQRDQLRADVLAQRP